MIKLRPEQEKIASYDSGCLAVPAVPGAGKTTTLAALAARLIAAKAYRIKLIISHHQVITCIGDCLDMTWCDISRSTNKRKILHKNI